MAETATYVYCIVHRSTRPRVPRGPSGLGGASTPRLVDIDKGLWMVCADVPLPTYGTESIERGLRDLDWVSRIAVAHEAVVERFTKVNAATVIPMKLFTIFANDERAREAMLQRRRDLGGIVKRIKGCQEWGVRILRGTRAATMAPTRALTSGSAFLAEKKRARDAVREQSQQMIRATDEAVRALGKLAREVRRREPPASAATPPLVDVAFLVPALRRTKFKSAAAKAAAICGAVGAELILTGPWPAYHFVHGGDSAA
jgi:Gas vesicle synthesis protein GvpL/GvpF